jgi:hypothetical protein
MGYNTEILKQKAIEAITKNKLLFVEDVCSYIGINKTTFYNHFQVESNDFNYISDLLEKNKIDLKIGMRKNWYEQKQNATLQMALYKLCSTDTEHRKLQQNYTDLTTDGEKIGDSGNIFILPDGKEIKV